MSSIVKETRENFIKKEMCDKKQISKQEYSVIEDKSYTLVDATNTLDEGFRYTSIIQEDFSKEQIDEFISIRTYKMLQRLDKNVSTIKSIVIFWLVLTLIGLVIYILSKFGY